MNDNCWMIILNAAINFEQNKNFCQAFSNIANIKDPTLMWEITKSLKSPREREEESERERDQVILHNW